jgi:inhibitor of KinA sporulation pathway (predicted exonuclease)
MRIVAVDLEMNQPSGRIIQIGAVCFHPENGFVVDTFNQLVNPDEVISDQIIALTRISNERVIGQPNIQNAASAFSSFKKKHQINPIGIVWGAGTSNDVEKIYRESGLQSPFKSRIIDVKGVYQMLANASSATMRQNSGLLRACENMKIGWDDQYGEPHDALADAWNTMRMYLFLSKCLKGAVEIKLG